MRSQTLLWSQWLAASVAVLTTAVIGCDAARPPHPAVGRGMGSLPIVSLDDVSLPVPALTGRVTLLNFWGTWCPPCRRELPGLVRIAERLAKEPRFQLVAVSCGSGGDGDDLGSETKAFLTSRQLPIAAWGFADPLATTLFASAYGLEAFPTTYLIGPDARVRRVWTGYRSSDEADIAASIVVLLREMPAEVRASPP
jgi:cytochrome c biogenesis protein CcmG/thiol:disulfide interchange protein DsbE